MWAKSAALILASATSKVVSQNVYSVSTTSPANAGQPFPEAFVSFSIELSSFPDFAGNKSSPNTFSDNLLTNLGNLQGTKPYVRVGGNTQDYALYNASLAYALNGTYNNTRSPDYPTTIYIGPSYFESYSTWPGVKFAHGFNLGGNNRPEEQWATLLATVPLACKALSGKLDWWEYGNEPDLFSTSSQGPVRPPGWNETIFVQQWLNGTRTIKQLLQQHCPEMLQDGQYGYLAPSFAGTNNKLKAPLAWSEGLNTDNDIPVFSTHNYISGAGSPGVTLQGTLMNHNTTMRSVNNHVTEYNTIFPSGSPIKQIFGETNSLYNQGKPGLSNSFGAALWGVDFNLYCITQNFKRVHMHMGTNYRYASWQPIETSLASKGTKAPYYGNIAVAAMLGDTTKHNVSVDEVKLVGDTREAAYVAYDDGQLARILILNMNGYNTTVNGSGEGQAPNISPRGSRRYTFDVGATVGAKQMLVQRLLANGSDAITGITFDGWSYNYELNEGKPVRLNNVTIGETVAVSEGKVTVEVPDSSAVILRMLGCSSTVKTSGAKRRRSILGR